MTEGRQLRKGFGRVATFRRCVKVDGIAKPDLTMTWNISSRGLGGIIG